MYEERLRNLLQQVAEGGLDPEAALNELKRLPFEDLGYAKVDHHRLLRTGFPEVIFCEGKTHEQIIGIIQAMLGKTKVILATRAAPEVYQATVTVAPDAIYHQQARIVQIGQPDDSAKCSGRCLIITGGTSDIPVAEEAAVTVAAAGCEVQRLYDVGVAGLHRLLEHQEALQKASVLIVIAGMEGALASVVGGLVDKPVIAVPTSVGYGASFGGLAALLTMLNSCASGVVVVNIDNGFGAGSFAALLCKNWQDQRQV